MRLFAVLLLLWAGMLQAANAVAALRYPEDFFVAAGEAAPELRVELKGDAQGLVQQARVLSSTRPELDADVTRALLGWHFHPDQKEGKRVAWTREVAFVFAALPAADVPARPKREMLVFYPKDMSWSGTDPEVTLEMAVAADGEIKSARVLQAIDPVLSRAAVRSVLWPALRFEPALQEGKAVTSLLRIPLVFTTAPVVVKQVIPTYPNELQRSSNQGKVKLAFTITTEGEVRDIRIQESAHPAMERAVVQAVGQWRFKPMTRRGQPVAGEILIPAVFSLDSPSGSVLRQFGAEPYAIDGSREFPEGLPEDFHYDQPPQVRVAQAAVYPLDLLRESVTGSAVVNLLIRPDGKVQEGYIVEAARPQFGLAARAAMEAWEFEPARKDGKPGWALISREVKFVRSGRDAPSESAQRLLRALKKAQPDIPALADLDALPQPIYQPVPQRPTGARGADARGTVIVEFFIDRDGRAQLPRALQAPDESMAWAAVTAVSRWQFTPPLRGGKPVDARATVPLEFNLPVSP